MWAASEINFVETCTTKISADFARWKPYSVLRVNRREMDILELLSSSCQSLALLRQEWGRHGAVRKADKAVDVRVSLPHDAGETLPRANDHTSESAVVQDVWEILPSDPRAGSGVEDWAALDLNWRNTQPDLKATLFTSIWNGQELVQTFWRILLNLLFVG